MLSRSTNRVQILCVLRVFGVVAQDDGSYLHRTARSLSRRMPDGRKDRF